MTSGRTALAILVLLLGTSLWMTTPAGAKPPRPPSLPALTGVVRDVCTGAKVANLSVSAEQPPGAPRVPTRVGVGTFKFVTLPADGIRLQVSAPGFAPLGDVVSPGVDIALPPSPPVLPTPAQAAATGDVVKIYLAPRPLPADCAPRNPMRVTPLTGTVHSSCNGDKVESLAVALDQTTGAPILPSKVNTGGFTLGPTLDGPSRLTVAAPGYAALGFPDNPGIDIVRPPGPPTVPAPQSIAIGTKTKIQLGPSAGCLHVG